ncbi:ubiquitin fusion degradation UFD1 family protein, partial [Reticulomyxa filosa]
MYTKKKKKKLGDKIVVPGSVLEQVSRLQVSFPIMFRITHDSDVLPKKSHCSVLEFTAEEGNVYLPLWMMDNLGLDPSGSSMVELETVSLSKGQFVEFQAHETKFAMLNNPRVVLENTLRSYSALTVGDTIP